MEAPYGRDVASDWANSQILVVTGKGFLDDAADEPAANALIPSCPRDDNRLHFGTTALVEQTGHADQPATGLGHPGSDSLRHGDVTVESRSRIIPADRRIPVDTSVVFGQLCPQISARAIVGLLRSRERRAPA